MFRFFRNVLKHFYKRYLIQAIFELSSLLRKEAGGRGIFKKIYFVSVTTKIGILLLFIIEDVSFLNVYTTIPYSMH